MITTEVKRINELLPGERFILHNRIFKVVRKTEWTLFYAYAEKCHESDLKEIGAQSKQYVSKILFDDDD